jgi:hypothetical protein
MITSTGARSYPMRQVLHSDQNNRETDLYIFKVGEILKFLKILNFNSDLINIEISIFLIVEIKNIGIS